MQEIETQLTILVTASAAGDEVRRDLIGRGVSLAGSTATLAQLRRSLVRSGDDTPIILCVTLDGPTLRRHGRSLARFLDDRSSFAAPVHAIGLMMDGRAADGWAGIGCDAHAMNVSQLQRLLRRFSPKSTAANRMPKSNAMLQSRFSNLDADVNVLRRSNDVFTSRADTRRPDLRRPKL